MSTPIGHIEFLVKFDSMSQSFEKAIRNAVGDRDVSVYGGFDWENERRLQDVETICKEILFLIRERLRSPFTSNYQAFLSGVIPEIGFAKSEETKKQFADILRTSPTGKRLYGQLSQEEAEEHAEDILNQYIILLEKALDRKSFEKNREKIANLQNALNQILLGSWRSLSEKFIQQISDKEFLAEQYRKILKRFGIEAEFKPRQWGIVQERVEYDKYKRIGKTRLPIRSEQDWYKAVNAIIQEYGLEVHAEKIFKRIFAGGEFSKIELPSVFGRFAERLLKKFSIEAGTETPKSILSFLGLKDPKLLERVWPEEVRRRGPRKDFFFTFTQEQLDNMEKADEFLKTTFETESYRKGLKDIGVAVAFGKFRDVMERAGTMKELGGLPQLTKEEVTSLTSKKFIESFQSDVQHVAEKLDHLIDISESGLDKHNLKTILMELKEYLDSAGNAPRTPKDR